MQRVNGSPTNVTPEDPPENPLDLAEYRYAEREIELLDALAAVTAERAAVTTARDALAEECKGLRTELDAIRDTQTTTAHDPTTRARAALRRPARV